MHRGVLKTRQERHTRNFWLTKELGKPTTRPHDDARSDPRHPWSIVLCGDPLRDLSLSSLSPGPRRAPARGSGLVGVLGAAASRPGELEEFGPLRGWHPGLAKRCSTAATVSSSPQRVGPQNHSRRGWIRCEIPGCRDADSQKLRSRDPLPGIPGRNPRRMPRVTREAAAAAAACASRRAPTEARPDLRQTRCMPLPRPRELRGRDRQPARRPSRRRQSHARRATRLQLQVPVAAWRAPTAAPAQRARDRLR